MTRQDFLLEQIKVHMAVNGASLHTDKSLDVKCVIHRGMGLCFSYGSNGLMEVTAVVDGRQVFSAPASRVIMAVDRGFSIKG